MNTVLTEEERALQMIYKEYADERIRPHTLEIDKGLFSVEPLLKEMHELGFCGIVIPKEYGGLGSSYVHYTKQPRYCHAARLIASVSAGR